MIDEIYIAPATGADGFEGFSAALLRAITGRSFIVSAGGSQPTADAVDLDGYTCIQSKRYRPTTALNLNDIVGNIYTALEAAPNLEVYVLTVTRDAAQLRQRTADVETNTGLDVVVLDAGDGVSPLGALVVTYWAALRQYLPRLNTTWDAWAKTVSSTPDVQAKAKLATSEIVDGLRTQAWLRTRSAGFLAQRFTPSATIPALNTSQRVDLRQAVERPGLQKQLTDWWDQTQRPNAVLEAEEGYGKTWAVAAFGLALATGNVPVLWLESSVWSGCRSIEMILREALKTHLPEGDPRLERFVRKALRLWSRPLLVVLDGVNEYECLESAQRLLSHYSDHAVHFAKHIRFLFTTRPLSLRRAWVQSVWRTCQPVSLTPFDDQEFNAALKQFAPDVTLESLPASVLPVARIPRYFHLCLRLLTRLRGLGQVTKPLLLFLDLLDKIECADQGTRHLYGNCLTDAEAILAYLARGAQSHLTSGWQVNRQHIAQCFPQLSPTLVELAEGKVLVERRPDSVVINSQHVVLGFALHLLHVGENSSATGIPQMAEELARELEPNREQDLRAEALYLALLLTCFRPSPEVQRERRLRTALLVLWWNNQNAMHDGDRLDFWGREDVHAYTGALETVFERFHSAPTEEALVSPIARQWRDQAGAKPELQSILERWLAVVYPSTCEEESDAERDERRLFPAVRSSPQLRLSAVALSILSLRPDEQMLPALARGARSMRFCSQKSRTGREKNTRVPLKDLKEVLSILICWGYGERIVLSLKALAEQTSDASLLDGLRTLGWAARTFELPSILQIEIKQPAWSWPDRSPPTMLAGFRQWIAGLPASEPRWPDHFEIGRLAVRSDLDSLRNDEAVRIADYLLTLGRQKADEPAAAGRAELESYPHLVTWLARTRPDLVPQVYAACWRHLLSSQNPNAIIVVPSALLTATDAADLVAKIDDDLALSEKAQEADAYSIALTTAVLLSADENTWIRWFEHLGRFPGLHYEAWQIIPPAWVLQKVATDPFRAEIRKRYEEAMRQVEAPSQISLFWLRLVATCGEANPNLAQWANEQLRSLDSTDARAELFLRVVAASGDAGVLETFLKDDQLKRHLRVPHLARVFGAFLAQPSDRKLQITYREVAGQLPLNLARGFLLMASGEDDLLDYARAVAATALARAAKPSEQPPFGFVSEFSVDDVGDVVGWGMDRDGPHNSRALHCGGSELWGVDRGSASDIVQMLDTNRDPDAAVASLNSELKRQNERQAQLPDAFVVSFKGAESLAVWSRCAADEYLAFCIKFFDYLAADRGHLFELGAFAHALLRPLCAIDLARACCLHRGFFTRDVVRVYRTGALDAFVADLWQKDLDGVAGIAAVRRTTVADCRTDLELLWVVLAAMQGETLAKLEQMVVDTWLKSEWGKERALAVTALGFTGRVAWRETLRTIQADDPSTWVRGQAAWATEVLDQSLFSRAIWDEICTQPVADRANLELLSARFIRLHDTLPPAAHFWPRPEWRNSGANVADGLFLAFWTRWEHSDRGKGEADIGSRRLKDFCRGIELRRDHATRMAPWWNPV
ncbi:hypothetical protein DB347_01415 [Opitutaceae bacterium EW11]|nr:hypothetical protein DB347_01415 [Opitutaceae bacterium EW11]